MEWALELGVLDLPVSTVTPVPLPQARALMFHSWNKNDVLAGYREWERVVIEEKKKNCSGRCGGRKELCAGLDLRGKSEA